MYCKNCGVELEENMLSCPLCGFSVNREEVAAKETPYGQSLPYHHTPMTRPQKKFTWEIISIVLLSGVITTLVVDYVVNHSTSWSEYTAAIGLVIFSYVSLFAFWNQRTIARLVGGFLVSSIALVVFTAITGGISWAIGLAIPLLFVLNLVVTIVIVVFRLSTIKGINLLAYAFVGAAVLCIAIEAILSFYRTELVQLKWSLIVATCIVPIVLVLLFIHFRLKRGRSLEKTFHV